MFKGFLKKSEQNIKAFLTYRPETPNTQHLGKFTTKWPLAAILDIGFGRITIEGCNLVLPMYAENFAAIGQGVLDLSCGNQTAEEKKEKEEKKNHTKT